MTPDFSPFSEHRRLSSVASFVTGELNLDHAGAREGEALNAAVQFYTNPGVHDVTNARFSDGRRYRIDLQKPSTSIDMQIDWKHPRGDYTKVTYLHAKGEQIRYDASRCYSQAFLPLLCGAALRAPIWEGGNPIDQRSR